MAKPTSSKKKTELLSKKIEELVVDRFGFPRFSLPFVGSGYSLDKKRRIMIIHSYLIRVSKSLLYSGKKFAYNDFYYKKADSLFKNPGCLRENPYSVEAHGFNLSCLIENVEKGMSCDDIVIHRFVPYPEIDGVEGSISEDVLRKAADLFVELVDCCQPTHVFFIYPNTPYEIDKVFNRFYGKSLQDFFDDRYIIALYGSDKFGWESFAPMDEEVDFIPSCAFDLLDDLNFVRLALDEPELRPALCWDDEKILYYGVDKKVFKHFLNNPDEVKKALLDEHLPKTIRRDLIRPFENLKYGQMLYKLLGHVHNDMYGDVGKGWNSACQWISLYNEYVKDYSKALKKAKDIYGGVRIRNLSISLLYAFMDLTKKLRLNYNSKKLAVMRRYIENLYNETEKLYSVHNPVNKAPTTIWQKKARSVNLKEWQEEVRSKKAEAQRIEKDEPKKIPFKKLSKERLDKLAYARSMRGKKKATDKASVKEDGADKKK